MRVTGIIDITCILIPIHETHIIHAHLKEVHSPQYCFLNSMSFNLCHSDLIVNLKMNNSLLCQKNNVSPLPCPFALGRRIK